LQQPCAGGLSGAQLLCMAQLSGKSPVPSTQAFLSSFGPIRQHFALLRHQMNAACHRAI
jgi:hypothetical protein